MEQALIERIAASAGKTVEEFNRDVEEMKLQQPPDEMPMLIEDTKVLKDRVLATEQVSAETNDNQQQLLELLIEMGVI